MLKSSYSRRQFLEKVGLVVGSAATMTMLPNSTLLAAGPNAAKRLIVGTADAEAGTFGLVNIDMYSFVMQPIPLAFLPHSFIQQPNEPDHIWAIDKWTRNLAKVDLKSGKVIKYIESPENTYFYGHGFFWDKGRTIYVTLLDEDAWKGALIAYDTETFKIKTRFDLTPGALHDCQILNDKIVLVASLGAIPNPDRKDPIKQEIYQENSALYHLDVSQEKAVNKVFVDDRLQLASHFKIQDGRVALGCRPYNKKKIAGAVYCGPVDGPLQRVDWGKAGDYFIGEMLSLAIDPVLGLAVVTNPDGQSVMVIDWKNHALLKTIDVWAQGVSYDPEHGFIISGWEVMFLKPQESLNLTVADLVIDSEQSFKGTMRSSHNLLI